MSSTPTKEVVPHAVAHSGHLPFHKQIIAGAFAGLCEVLAMYPLDVVKTRFQLSKAGPNPSMYSAMRDIVKEGGVSRLYRGIASPIFAEAPKRAIKFAANEQYKELFKVDGKLSTLGAAGAGAMAGMTEAFVNCPFEVVKVRVQAKENLGLYRSTGHAVSSILKSEGVLSLYTGLESMLWRNAVWNGVYFATINQFKSMMPVATTKGENLWNSFMAGALAGALATAANSPIDVAKSRIQSQPRTPGVALTYVWTIPSLVTVVRTEGWRAAYKGFAPRLLRLGPGGGIMLLAFELAKDLLA